MEWEALHDVNELTTVLLEWYTTRVFDDIERLGTK